MKKIVFVLMVFSSCTPKYNTFFTTHEGKEEKVLQGVIKRNTIESDTTFKWFSSNYNYAQPTAKAIEIIKQQKSKFKIIVFGGTWCEDTQNLLPLFYKLMDKSEYPSRKLTLVGVDRDKKSGNDLSSTYKITNVPSFIVLRNDGKEVGRVVEYGKGIGIDNELAEIVSTIK